MTIDLDKPIPKKDETLQELLERLNRSVDKLVEIQTPGVHGIEGTEVIPELRITTVNIPPGNRFEIMGNRRRKRLSISISRVQTGGAQSTTAFVDVTTRDSWDSPGYFLTFSDELTFRESTNSVYLRAVSANREDAANPVTVTIIEESS